MRYLSLEWIDAIAARVAEDPTLAELAHGHEIGLTQLVTGGPEGDVTYHVQVGSGAIAFAPFGLTLTLPKVATHP